jgi:4'-phosphopantetheinyl transferase
MIAAWQTTDEVPDLGSESLHVWLVKLDESLTGPLQNSLSKPELERAAAFRFPIHRNEFVVARGTLRYLLGKYMNVAPATVDIRPAKFGKPYVTSGKDLQFNVSHSGSYAVLGFAFETTLGIDIERHNTGIIDAGMLEQCLTSWEQVRYLNASAAGKTQFFFDTWARKEAYMKLVGDGMSIPPNEFTLSSPDAAEDMIRGENIQFTALPFLDSYSAALATKDRTKTAMFYRLGSNLLR